MSYCYKITGGSSVSGVVDIPGAKNFATKAMVAATLTNEITRLLNVPIIGDTAITESLLSGVGALVERPSHGRSNEVDIKPSTIVSNTIPLPDSGSNRIPILLMGALLHRFDEVSAPFVAGCNIGGRPVDFHLEAMRLFGAEVSITNEGYRAVKRKRLTACHYALPYPSVGATESCLLLGVLASGTTVIQNCAQEPEIIALITMLNAMGGRINFSAGRTLTIQGVNELHGTVFSIIGDRIEAASWAALAAATDSEITINGISPEILVNFFGPYNSIGGGVEVIDKESLRFYRHRELSPVSIETDVYPGFATDWQQPITALLTQANGVSVVHETVYENRFGYVQALNQLGANIQVVNYCLGGGKCRYYGRDYPHSAIISGKTRLKSEGLTINIPDLRAGLAYVMAAFIAEGVTYVSNVELLERGYGDLALRAPFLDIKKE
ncbi:MAG: UDP-N-acetylglucosamine 1-carboxyvinyltransferase [Chlorobiaceae bacterium]|nr:UDP-N-acetylglucosamine 1-carboxyvinyltransferase [Chlorobiaceae bacterium]